VRFSTFLRFVAPSAALMLLLVGLSMALGAFLAGVLRSCGGSLQPVAARRS
jgi:Kef-type K+ transport system membrane component KefB